jgi:hypothetical protein
MYIHRHKTTDKGRVMFYFKLRLGEWALPLFSGKMFIQKGPIDRASPYLRTPESTQGI